MSPKRTTRNVTASRTFKPMAEDAPTEFARLVIQRLNQLQLNKNQFSMRLCEVAGREWHRGVSGPLHFILTGVRPPSSLADMDAWVGALDYSPRSPEAAELKRAAAEHVAFTATGGKGTAGESLAKRLHKIEAENRALRERNQELESEVAQLRTDALSRSKR